MAKNNDYDITTRGVEARDTTKTNKTDCKIYELDLNEQLINEIIRAICSNEYVDEAIRAAYPLNRSLVITIIKICYNTIADLILQGKIPKMSERILLKYIKRIVGE